MLVSRADTVIDGTVVGASSALIPGMNPGAAGQRYNS
jgi:hypothetical protein